MVARQRRGDEAATRRELHGIVEQVPDDLLQPLPIAEHQAGLGGQVFLQSDAFGIGRGLHRLERRFDDLRQIRFLRIQSQAPAQQAAHVDQIIHQLGEVSHIAINGLAATLHIFGRQAAGFEQARPAENGMQRGAQLVPQGGQKLILESTDAFGFRAQRALVGETLARILRVS